MTGISKDKSDWIIYRRLLSYVGRYWVLLICAFIGFALAAGAEAYFVTLFGSLIDGWEDAQVRAAATIPILMGIAAISRALGAIAGEAAMSRVSFGVVYDLREELFGHILKSPSRYFDGASQGHIVSQITFTVTQLRDTGTDALRALIKDGLKVIAYLVFLLLIDWRLTMLFIAMAPLLGLIVVFASNRFRRISRRIQHSMGDVTHVVSEVANGYREVKIFGGQNQEEERFLAASKVNRQQNMKMVITKVLSSQTNESIIVLALCGLILVLYSPEFGVQLSSGKAVEFLVLAGMLGRPIRNLSEVNAKLQRGFAAAEDIFAQLDSGIEANLGTYTLERAQGEVTVRNVSFRYADDGPDVLKDIELSIAPAQTVALVGRSGSGKSTLASLLPRFYEVEHGSILLDGQDIQSFELTNLRRHISFVSQQVTLFNDTLRNNIAYGDMAGASDEQINEALRRSYADEFVSKMPDGLETLIGDDGVLLSGGQRQRIAIARALLKDSPVLIMDEATSALDNESEKAIQGALEEVMQGRTTLVIAHRLSTVESADVIVVMDQGKIVEKGSHQVLLAKGGLYSDLYGAQFQDEEVESQVPVSGSLRPTGETSRQGSLLGQSANAITRAWYNDGFWVKCLLPLSWLYGWISGRRATRQRLKLRDESSADKTELPVLVVGNITVGGTGKTPLVLALVELLSAQGYSPGVVSRGYKGKLSRQGALIPAGASASVYSDEGVMLKQKLQCPVAIAAERNSGIALLKQAGCDLVIADDGLQHYAMARDVEIAVVDAARGVGNGLLLPAGPLREPVERLSTVDLVISHGGASGLVPYEYTMQTVPLAFKRLSDGTQTPTSEFAERYPWVHALCGIGNPSRFLRSLTDLGISVEPHLYPDHHGYTGDELDFAGGHPIVCTEKDAMKLTALDVDLSFVWALEISLDLDPNFTTRLFQLMTDRGIRPSGEKQLAESSIAKDQNKTQEG
ncbi:lipid A export permease/ATP-binding protein MsbA [Pseudomonadales bacterium]|nr:lipid A export permease/ATP-binding protein MsbA [Pseudomonadales bacterium]